eukprot:6600233-Pyramimonas_sp.AAC.1
MYGRQWSGEPAGPDGAPLGFWKILSRDEGACEASLEVCQRCWGAEDIPDTWRRANVMLRFMKGGAHVP